MKHEHNMITKLFFDALLVFYNVYGYIFRILNQFLFSLTLLVIAPYSCFRSTIKKRMHRYIWHKYCVQRFSTALSCMSFFILRDFYIVFLNVFAYYILYCNKLFLSRTFCSSWALVTIATLWLISFRCYSIWSRCDALGRKRESLNRSPT